MVVKGHCNACFRYFPALINKLDSIDSQFSRNLIISKQLKLGVHRGTGLKNTVLTHYVASVVWLVVVLKVLGW